MRAYSQILGIILLSVQSIIGADRAGLDWWSLSEVKQPAVPEISGDKNVKPIDAFIKNRLKEQNIEPSPPSDKYTLIRRLHFDLIGIPPSHEEIKDFSHSEDKNSYSELVERLLGSPRFGERWARHWLDVVRYAETNGYERDAVKPHIWKYRDWVIKAFNSDMPYDQFVTDQLSGDEIDNSNESSVIATGMLRAGTWNDEPNDAQEYKYERLEDMVDVVSTAFLGMTVRCARCHDHKFDPIPQQDYYRMAAAFWAGTIEPGSAAIMGGPSAEQLGHKEVFGWTDVHRDPPPLHLLINGDPDKKSKVIEPGHLSLAPHLDRPLISPPKESRTSWRRLQLADFITNPSNPLTARVMVNRIWQHLMGKGIVATPNNFGFKSARPTHPELLDWIANDFIKGGWSIKEVIRKIVLSDTYKQSSLHPKAEKCMSVDPGNKLLWRNNMRRMDAESLRDSLLHVSGELDLRMGGKSFYPELAAEALEGFSRKSSAWTPSPLKEQFRRSVYMISKRHLLVPLMTAFDFPSSEKPCGNRNSTTVVSQSLAMLNNHFVHARSQRLANHANEVSNSKKDAISFAWKKILGRAPSVDELTTALDHYNQQVTHFKDVNDQAMQVRGRSPAVDKVPSSGLHFWVSADAGKTTDSNGKLLLWKDLSGNGHDVTQADSGRRPIYVGKAIGNKPAMRFSGKREFLKIKGQVIKGQEFTFFAVASDRSSSEEHREIISNWNGRAGNSTNSLFLGLTGKSTVRFSDDFSSKDKVIGAPGHGFLLSASSGRLGSQINFNGQILATRSSSLKERRMDTEWVIGQQGNIEGEYWQGDIAELLVYERQLEPQEMESISKLLAKKYDLTMNYSLRKKPVMDPELQGLASVCHVLLNSNEFLYID